MSRSRFAPPNWKDAASAPGGARSRRRAGDGVTLNQWISSAVARKIGAVETAAVFLKARAGEAKLSDITAFLKRARNALPAAADEMM